MVHNWQKTVSAIWWLFRHLDCARHWDSALSGFQSINSCQSNTGSFAGWGVYCCETCEWNFLFHGLILHLKFNFDFSNKSLMNIFMQFHKRKIPPYKNKPFKYSNWNDSPTGITQFDHNCYIQVWHFMKTYTLAWIPYLLEFTPFYNNNSLLQYNQ